MARRLNLKNTVKILLQNSVSAIGVTKRDELNFIGNALLVGSSLIYHNLLSHQRWTNLKRLGAEFERLDEFHPPEKPDFGTDDLFYDVGANTGVDTAYFLNKGARVVAIDANPTLAAELSSRFKDAVRSGRLYIYNVAIADGDGQIPFFIDRKRDGLSCIYRPTPDMEDPYQIMVQAESLSSIVRKHGAPYCVKIDIEGADIVGLRQLFKNDIYPRYVSAECHTMDVVWALVNAGYRSFKVVEGRYVEMRYYQNTIITAEGEHRQHIFPSLSCGPVAQDIPGEWLTTREMLDYFAKYGPGWKDLHAMQPS